MRSTFFTSLNKALSTEICHELFVRIIEIDWKTQRLLHFVWKSQRLLYLFENHNACYIFLVFIFPCRYQRPVMSSNGKLKFSGASVVKAGSWEIGGCVQRVSRTRDDLQRLRGVFRTLWEHFNFTVRIDEPLRLIEAHNDVRQTNTVFWRYIWDGRLRI